MVRDTLYAHVPSEGALNARVIVLGESPWINEVAAGRPFAGASGNLLSRWWGPLGISRTHLRLMNLFPYRPPTREITSIPLDKLVSAIEGVHERIARLKEPYVIVPMGNYATYALTGKGKVKAAVRKAFGSASATEAEKKAGITQLRGSIYPYRDLNGRIIKVVPMIHPAAVLQMPKWEKRSIADWGRVVREAQFREVREPGRNHIIRPSEQQIAEFCQRVYAGGGALRMAIDIETWGNEISCVGFAISPWESITLPTTGKERSNMGYVDWLCRSEAQKCLTNGSYDWYWLDAAGVQLKNYVWDCMAMHHALYPAESHSLDFLASIYCPHYVYWKDEAKEAEEIVKYARDLDSLYVYNGLDCCYTRELVDLLEAELVREGMRDFYLTHYARMFEPLVRTMRHGIRVDVQKQKSAAKAIRAELAELHEKLNALAGEELFAVEERTALREPSEQEWDALLGEGEVVIDEKTNAPAAKSVNREARAEMQERGLTYMINGKNAGMVRYKVSKAKKDFSGAKLLGFFYDTLGLPKMSKVRKKKNGDKKASVSLDEDSLRKLMYKYAKAVEPGSLLLRYREKKKELDYLKGAYDKDGRVRCSYKMNTRAGRLSSSTNPMKSGLNLQNLKR